MDRARREDRARPGEFPRPPPPRAASSAAVRCPAHGATAVEPVIRGAHITAAPITVLDSTSPRPPTTAPTVFLVTMPWPSMGALHRNGDARLPPVLSLRKSRTWREGAGG